MHQTLTHSAQLRQIIVARRRALKLSQRDLAAKLAISQNRLSEIETGRAPITFERLVDLFKVLGLDLVVQDRNLTPKAVWWGQGRKTPRAGTFRLGKGKTRPRMG